ncbi:MAG: 3-methyl-2-oxobutanoate hydroxymethyltransferase [Planctomycetaceae bacterium]|nr:3-methyl-2-oxobutanoate hydroxymethyltransferase [Planctomycetaceae bacterium]
MSARPVPDATPVRSRPMTVPRFVAAKQQGRKLSVLTAYDFLWAALLDAAGTDAILVGDSLGMVVQGKATTLPVTLDEMIYHAEMVVRAVRQALVIVDMPFLTFHVSPQQALENAGTILKKTGAGAVKLEGGVNQATTIRTLTDADIPVMAHVGLKPQSVLKLGGYKIQRDAERLMADARAAEEAGAFGIVLECIPRGIAAQITAAVGIPTIGIGAGPDCDGQVLVTQDLLGLTGDGAPKFVKQFANLGQQASTAVRQFVAEVQGGRYPDEVHSHV